MYVCVCFPWKVRSRFMKFLRTFDLDGTREVDVSEMSQREKGKCGRSQELYMFVEKWQRKGAVSNENKPWNLTSELM